jgi:predicted O-methyltransferase YrrM
MNRRLSFSAEWIESILCLKLTDTEQRWIDKIELVRQELTDSLATIEFVDYGAISAESNLTTREMYEGRIVQTTVGRVCRQSSQSSKSGLLLFKLIRLMKPLVCLELGTCLGVSTAYIGAALVLNERGGLTTLEGALPLATLAKDKLNGLGLHIVEVCVGRFQDNLKSVISKHKPIDFVFVDGHHDELATVSYFNTILPQLSAGAVVVFDDVDSSNGMIRAWNRIQRNERVKSSLDFHGFGLCRLGQPRF